MLTQENLGMGKDDRVLIVDDDFAQAEMVSEFLRISGYTHIDHVPDVRSVWHYLANSNTAGRPYDIILLDYKLPDGTGLDILDEMARRGYRIPAVMITGQGNERIAVQAIQHGAADYLLKGGEYLITLPALIHKTIQAHHLKISIERTQEQIRYQALLLNNVRDAVVVWDMSGLITYWNPAATSLFGWSAEERLGRPVAQIYLSSFSPPITLPLGSCQEPAVRREWPGPPRSDASKTHRRRHWAGATALRTGRRGSRHGGDATVTTRAASPTP